MSNVHSPAHYTQGKIELIEIIEQIIKDYPPEQAHLVGTCIKYLGRAPYKGKKNEDLEKALWYLTRAVTKYDRTKNERDPAEYNLRSS